MFTRLPASPWLTLCVLLTAASPLAAAQRVRAELLVDGLEQPVLAISPPGDARLFVLEENFGRARVIENGALLPAPFLDIGAKITFGGEMGLLGMAFHPDYANNGYFYLSYNDVAANSIISRWSVSAADPNLADPNSELVMISIPQPFSNHNGGMIGFGPNDGYLYAGFGDGGGPGDPFNNAQSGGTLLGKMLRLDVDGGSPYAIPPDNPFVGNAAFLDEIWAYGLRNPWRWSFDRATGDLWIGDVGLLDKEEIDYQPGTSSGGENYGWRLMEGSICFDPPTNCNPGGLVLPFHEYDWSSALNRRSVIAGFAYRGSAIPGLQGTFFFADWTSHEIWSMRAELGAKVDFADRTEQLDPGGGRNVRNVASFGENASGELYVLDRNDGEVFRILPDLMELTVTNLVAGQTATAAVSRATPGATVFFGYSTTGEGLTPVPQLSVNAYILSPRLAGIAVADAAGNAGISQALPGSLQGTAVWLQAVELANSSNVFAGTVQ